jgi:hypothetical protein
MESDFFWAFTEDRYCPSPEPQEGDPSSLFQLRSNYSYCDLVGLRHCLHKTTPKKINANLHPRSDFSLKSLSHCSRSRDSIRLRMYISDIFGTWLHYHLFFGYQHLRLTCSNTAIFRSRYILNILLLLLLQNYPLLWACHNSPRSLILHY